MAPPAAPVSVGNVHVVPASRWDDLLARLGGLDSYTCAAYHQVSALIEAEGTIPVLLHHVDSETALPLLLRPLPDGCGWDATSAYGYGGPVASGRRSASNSLGADLDAWARKNRVVTTFLRLHPLLSNAVLVPPTAELLTLGGTVAWDISPGRDLLPLMHAHHRRAVRKAERAGLQVGVVLWPSDLSEFRALYETAMGRLGAEPFYFFPDAYWEALVRYREALGLVLVQGRLGGELTAGLLCFVQRPWLHFHLGASSEAARTTGASHRCFLAAAEWAQAIEMSRFHLGGGVGGGTDSSLLTFKHRFDPAGSLLPFQVAKLVHDRERYRQLAGTDATAGYFPAWRKGR